MTSTQRNDNFQEIQHRTTRLIATLEDANLNIKVHALLDMLDECLSICPVESVDEKIFAIVLSNACQLNLKVMNEVYAELEKPVKDVDQIKTWLKICHSLLNCWQKSLKYIKQFKHLAISKIQIFTDSLLNVTMTTLENCKTSESRYASCREQVAEELKMLFRSSIITLKELFTVWDGSIVVETNNDIKILLHVIDKVAEMASFIKDLDMSSSIELWKKFGKFVVKYEKEINQIEENNIRTHFQQISRDIISLLPCIIQERPMKAKEKTVTYLSLLFQILIKLCKVYKLTISNHELTSFLELLIQMKCYSSFCLKSSEVDFNIIKQIDLNMSSQIESFLEICLKNEEFVKVFFNYKKKHEKDAVGYHLLTLDIIKYVVRQNYDQQRQWISDNSIIDEILLNIDSLKFELCLNKLYLPSLSEESKSFTLYEATLISLYSLICQIPASNFMDFELLLLKHLLGGQLWASLLSSDLWCFISRIGPPKLCMDYVKFFITLYQEFFQRNDSFELIIIHNLISRLYSKLLDKHKELASKEFENINAKIKIQLLPILSDKVKMDIERTILSDGINIFASHQKLCIFPTVDNLNNFMNDLLNLGLINMKWSDETSKTVLEIWNKVSKMISEDQQGTSIVLMSNLIENLFCISRIQGSDSMIVCVILKSISESYVYMSPHLRIKTCHYLKHNACYFICNDTNLVQWLAKLYCCLLEDNVPLIRQEAFESFDYFIQSCPNEDLINKITKVIVNRSTICDSVRAYITHESYSKNEFGTLENYLKQTINYGNYQWEHKCYLKDERKRDDKFPRIEETDPVSLSSLEQKIELICKEINEVKKYKSQLKDNSVDKLRMALLEFIN